MQAISVVRDARASSEMRTWDTCRQLSRVDFDPSQIKFSLSLSLSLSLDFSGSSLNFTNAACVQVAHWFGSSTFRETRDRSRVLRYMGERRLKERSGIGRWSWVEYSGKCSRLRPVDSPSRWLTFRHYCLIGCPWQGARSAFRNGMG